MNANEPNADIHNCMTNVMDDTRALLSITRDATQKSIMRARCALFETLQAAEETCASLRPSPLRIARLDSPTETASANFCEAAGVTFGMGALIGYLIGRHR